MKNERGSALILALLALMIITPLGLGLIVLGMKERNTVALWKAKTQVFYIADAGLEQAKVSLGSTETCPTGAQSFAGGTVFGGSFATTCVTGSRPASWQVQSVGTSRVPIGAINIWVTRTVSALVQVRSPFARWALFGDEGTVLLNGNPVVTGNIGSNGKVIENGNATVIGTITQNAGVTYPTVACPTTPYTSSVVSSGLVSLVGGVLTANGAAAAVVLTGPADFYFHSIKMNAGATLTVSGPVRIFIDGALDTSGGTLLNTTGSAANLLIASCGGNTQPWAVNGGNSALYALYAPTNPVTLNGNATITGSIIAGSITDNGGPSVVWDPSLLDPTIAGNLIGAQSLGYGVVPGTWEAH